MKKLVLIIIAVLFTIVSNAQWSYKFLSNERHFLYTSGDFIVGNQNSGQISLNYVYNTKYIINFGYSATTKDEASLPNEILKSATELIPAFSTPAFTNSENLHLMVGRVFNLNREGTFRVLLQGGPGFYTKRAPAFTVKSNMYDYQMESSKELCFVLNPKVEIPLGTIGISAGPMAVLNQNEKYIGAGVGIMYGILGKD
ncbi:MAG TPA: hypothetical protein PK335_04105 [Draconibacterium sp.]|nr:hypothetical protein [Draconibacterium sp.]